MLFDAYIFIDWSAVNEQRPRNPTKDSPWVGELIAAEAPNVVETYHRTRQVASDHVCNRLIYHIGLNHRILVGFDFPYGYPHGCAQALGLNNGAPWINIWQHLSSKITDNPQNNNNRFQVAADLNNVISGGGVGPFWGHPKGRNYPHMRSTQPVFPFNAVDGVQLPNLRICETRLPGVSATWKLFGPGSVGSQTLTGIPRLHSLVKHPILQQYSRVWPFQTGFGTTPQQGIHAEIWPGVVAQRVRAIQQGSDHIIPDRAQVRAMCQWAHDLDQENHLGELFDVPAGLNHQEIEKCRQEEGWILGAT